MQHHLKFILILVTFSTAIAVENDSLFFFFTKGIRRVYFEQLNHLPNNISQPCKHFLIKMQQNFNSGDLSANKFVDSSASVPVSIFTGTVTDLGSYDGCASIEQPSQYCLIESIPSKSMPQSPGSIKLKNALPSLSYFNITSGVCMPKTCTGNDVATIWSFWLSKYSMELTNGHNIACSGEDNVIDTSSKALYALLIIILIQILIGIKALVYPSDSMIEKVFSPFVHLKDFFHTSDRKATVVDCLKVFMILMGISAHCLLCIEKLVAIALLGKMSNNN